MRTGAVLRKWPALNSQPEYGHVDRMHTDRGNHAATLLLSARCWFVGGHTSDQYSDIFVTGSAELYDPATGEWRVTAGTFRNAASTATLPDSGEVLLID